LHYDFEYDQRGSFGELFSTSIISDYWQKVALQHQWVDVRTVLKTDDLYRDANVDWELTQKMMQTTDDEAKGKLWLTQGFLGGTRGDLRISVGRSRSGWLAPVVAQGAAAAAARFLDDGPYVLNDVPRWSADALALEELWYNEAIDL